MSADPVRSVIYVQNKAANARTLTAHTRKVVASMSVYHTTSRLCRVCSTDISDRHFNAKFCQPCYAEHLRVKEQERMRKRRVDPVFLQQERRRDREHKRVLWQDPDYRDNTLARRRERYHANPVLAAKIIANVQEALRRRMQRDPEGFRAYRRAYFKLRRATDSAFAEKIRKAGREGMRRRYRTNPKVKEMVLHNNQIRRARKLGQMGHVSPGIKATLQAAQGNRCALCAVSLSKHKAHLDHIVPLALGGLHDDANLEVTCSRCNGRKGSKDTVAFAMENGRLF